MTNISLIQNQLKAIIGMDLHNISCAACGEPIDATDKVIQERIFEKISDKYRTNIGQISEKLTFGKFQNFHF